MTPERWIEIERIFEEALDVAPAGRAAFLDGQCRGDDALREEVESLLAAHRDAVGFTSDLAPLADAEVLLQRGDRLGQYEVVGEIARGGMGAIYHARRADGQYEQNVAIKVLKRGVDTAVVLRHFRDERQILARFDHPNIARLFDGGTTASGVPYFVMEHVDGVPIDRYCDEHRLTIDQRLKLFLQVCEAVAYAHRHLVVHRDIKPSNILVTAAGVPKLLDFGIAKILQPEADSASTATGLRLMTPDFASPEQALGRAVTTVSDVYSLGVVLYGLLTGCPPYRFDTLSPLEFVRTIVEVEPTRPSEVTPVHARRLKGDLDTIVLMALRKEPQRRYQSVEQFAEDIRRHLDGRPVVARKDTPVYRLSMFVRRNRVAVAAAALVVMALLGGIIATSRMASLARRQENIARSERERAERRFAQVRQLANAVLFDYHDAIKDLPGSTPIRERLVQDALEYLDALAREAGEDAGLQRELAAAYERIGDVRGATYGSNFGDVRGALESYTKAMRIRESLVRKDSKSAENRRALAKSYREIGNQMIETAEERRGVEYLRKSLALYRELATPGPVELSAELADVYNDLGAALEDRRDLAGALESHRLALSLRERLLAANPKDRRHRRALSVTYENMGRALYLQDRVREAMEMNDRSLALRRALRAEDPTNADFRRMLAISYQNAGDFSPDPRAALENFRRKLVIDEELFAADPNDAQAIDDLAYSSQRIAFFMAATGDSAGALPHYRRAMSLLDERLRAGAPDNLTMRYRAITIRSEIARLEAKLGRANALKECRRTRELLASTGEAAEDAALRGMKARSYMNLGDAWFALGSRQEARRMYEQSLQIMRDLRARGHFSDNEATDIARVERQIRRCHDPAQQRIAAR